MSFLKNPNVQKKARNTVLKLRPDLHTTAKSLEVFQLISWDLGHTVHAYRTHSHVYKRVPVRPTYQAGYGTGQFSSLSPSLFHPSPIPAVLAKALRDLSHDNEKLKCDGFNYNLYFHLTINYLPLIGGTSLS